MRRICICKIFVKYFHIFCLTSFATNCLRAMQQILELEQKLKYVTWFCKTYQDEGFWGWDGNCHMVIRLYRRPKVLKVT
jgi:hypothetical protein